MSNETKTIEETQEINIKKFTEIFHKANETGQVVLIDTIRQYVPDREIRCFYDPLTLAFVMGPNAAIDGFVLPDGTVLEEVEEEMKICYLDNIVNISRGLFENDEAMIGYAQNLWMTFKLHVTFSNDFDPSYLAYINYKNLLFGEVREEDFIYKGDLVLVHFNEFKAGDDLIDIYYDREAKTFHIFKNDELYVSTTLPADVFDAPDDSIVIYTAIQMVSELVTTNVKAEDK